MRTLWIGAIALGVLGCGNGAGASPHGTADAAAPDAGVPKDGAADGASTDGTTPSQGSDAGVDGSSDAGAVLPTATHICGTSVLQGPTSPPAGAVTLAPGPATIQNAIAQHSGGGTTYYLTAGTYAISSAIEPNDHDTFIGAPGAIIDGSNTQPVAFGLNDHATGVTIEYVTIQRFAGPQNNGIVNQGQGTNWTFQYNTVENNPDTSGGANGFELGDGDVVAYNCFTGNGQTAIASVGNTGFVIDHNEIATNAVGYEAAHPCGCSGGIKLFTSTKGIVTNNWIHDNGSVGLWLDTNNSFFLVQGNVIENNEAEGLMVEISYNTVIDGNLFRSNGIRGNAQAADFPEPVIYVSESGGFDAGAAVLLSGVDVNGVLRITNDTFVDNADGVVLYQNGTRCCGAKDGCSGSCAPLPLYPEIDADGNQRWNTQNVTVSNDTFTYGPDAGCTTQPSQHNFCAVTAMFSTLMSVDQAIAFHQNNVFENNVYTGPWQFLSPDQGSALMTPAAWQAAPFNQDPGSVFR